LTETGLVGAIAFGLIFIVLIFRSLLALKYVRGFFTPCHDDWIIRRLYWCLVQYNFFSTLYIIHIWVLIGLLVAVQNLIFKENKMVRSA